ncbi:hypothetical protein [Parendozoicomonas haliclonae]|uniref:Uncharacterized protein n=1 Tax=Parendozoicomonas haliclonae TaxID=1960125 RepID=A0A1X7AL55_9GAMM|nr:hypothetical protein [Parendozoicomonas haliclonae]SMA48624.1 hypothetical protein EHSB41UT_02818 [Parendozoicomonas haliclonae]
MQDSRALYENFEAEEVGRRELQRLRYEEYERKRKKADLILERRRLKELLDMDDLDFDW